MGRILPTRTNGNGTPGLQSVQSDAMNQLLRRIDDARFFDDYVRWRCGGKLRHSTQKEMQEFEKVNVESYLMGWMTEPKRQRFEAEVWNWQSIVKQYRKRFLRKSNGDLNENKVCVKPDDQAATSM